MNDDIKNNNDSTLSGSDDVAEKAVSAPVEEENLLKELVLTVVYAMVIVLSLRIFLFEPFNIPSGSMTPTLVVGDYLFVSKYPYGYSRHSIPKSPDLFSGRIGEDPVKRGDVAVFKLPRDGQTDYIKRIIGLPGDKIQVRNSRLYLNGEIIPRKRVEDFILVETANYNCGRFSMYRVRHEDGQTFCHFPQYQETLPNGVTYMTLDMNNTADLDNTRVFEVPKGHYFGMGDNRDNSTDSRRSMSSGVGFIPAENLVGRAERIFFSTNGDASWWEVWNWYGATRGDRVFTTLRPGEVSISDAKKPSEVGNGN